MTAQLLTLVLLAQAADGGTKAVLTDPVYDKCPEADAPVQVQRCKGDEICIMAPSTQGNDPVITEFSWPFEQAHGYLMTTERAQRLACFMGACEGHRLTMAETLKTADSGPGWKWWAVGIGTALTVGAIVGYSYAQLTLIPRAPQ